MPKFATERKLRLMNFSTPMSELALQIERYEAELVRVNGSPHTLVAYSADLRQFLDFLSPPETAPPAPAAIDVLTMREWLAWLYGQELDVMSIRRKLAAVRSFFRFLVSEGVVPINVARLVRTPRAPKRLPEVPSAEQVNTLLDGVASNRLERPHPARDRAIFELLYGCGMRVSELVGMNLEDLDRTEGWVRLRGKGRKERQVPLPRQAAEAVEERFRGVVVEVAVPPEQHDRTRWRGHA